MMRRGAAAALAVTMLLAGAPTARAEGVDSLPPVTDQEIAAAIHDIKLSVDDIELKVTDMERTEKKGSETVVSLASDILFAFGSAELAPAASTRLAEIVKPVPQGASLKVYGYTDRIGTDAYNLTLSKNRAQAVAAVIAKARPDLKLDVQGRGKADPVADNGTPENDNPAGRALNRRVELRFAG